jgi:two-component system, chemotaxis family, CheB/CheR fusion protein
MAEKVLNLIPADLDRSIGHINPNIDGVNLEQLIGECIDTISPVEREVRDRQGHWYSLRIRPYRSVENRIDGAVLSLFDIDAPKRFEETTRSAIAFAEAIVAASQQPMAVVDDGLKIKSANDAFVQAFSTSGDGLRGKSMVDVTKPGAGIEQLRSLATSETDGKVVTVELEPGDGARRKVRLSARTLHAYDALAKRVVVLTVG